MVLLGDARASSNEQKSPRKWRVETVLLGVDNWFHQTRPVFENTATGTNHGLAGKPFGGVRLDQKHVIECYVLVEK